MIFHSLTKIVSQKGSAITGCSCHRVGRYLETWRRRSHAASHGSYVFTRIMIDDGKSQVSYIMTMSLFPSRCKGFVINLFICHMLLF